MVQEKREHSIKGNRKQVVESKHEDKDDILHASEVQSPSDIPGIGS